MNIYCHSKLLIIREILSKFKKVNLVLKSALMMVKFAGKWRELGAQKKKKQLLKMLCSVDSVGTKFCLE